MEVNFSIRNRIATPIYILLLFNVLTLFLFFTGPICWELNIGQKLVTLFYVLTNLTMLYLGYYCCLRNYSYNKYPRKFSSSKYLLAVIILIGIFWMVPRALLRLGFSTINFNVLYNYILVGLKNPYDNYHQKVELAAQFKGGLLYYLDLLLRPLMTIFFPLVLLRFRKYSLWVKSVIVSVFILEFLSWISIGTNKGVMDLLLIFVCVGLIAKPKYFKVKVKNILIIAFVALSFIGYFSRNMSSRHAIEGKDSAIVKLRAISVVGNEISEPWKFNPLLYFAYVKICSYLTQGYYSLGLGLSMWSQFNWTYGFGNSWFTIEQYEKIFGKNLIEMSYMGKLHKKYNIDPMINWQTIYLWLASDFSFFIVPLVVFVIGFMFALSWLDTLYKVTIFALPNFCMFFQMIFYFFANNQIFSFSFLPFIFVFSFWMLFRSITK